MSIITATYATIARELWGQQAIGAVPTAVQIETIKSKRRVSHNKNLFILLKPREYPMLLRQSLKFCKIASMKNAVLFRPQNFPLLLGS